MTRINVVPVEILCDQHLLAEHREMARIPNCLLSGRLKYDYADRADDYVLGKGHIKFFSNKLGWLRQRYDQLHAECIARGFNVHYWFRYPELEAQGFKFENWEVTDAARRTNFARIQDKMPPKPRHTKPK